MELLEDTSALDRTVRSCGCTTVQRPAREQAKNILQQKIAYYRSKTDFFEQKYALGFKDYCDNFDKITNHSVIEKGDDSIHWKTALDVLTSCQSELNDAN